jgi:predicted RNase H-like HicB family nuclease/uncharacterized damage-inducible protein DinB
MSRYPVYLEIAADGRCMAHVLALPGCSVRAPTRAEALHRLPEAIRDTYDWLRRHGEPAPPAEEPIEFEVAGVSTGFGPFDPGDAATLFPPDREPISPDEMEHHFRLMDHARADLLALTGHLPEDLLDWIPHPGSFSIRRILRHVGNAEQWYVSRIVPPDSLPPEWSDDEDLPFFEFLETERRTSVARLRQLTEQERAGVHYPLHWTNTPGEAWTARKTLRRFLEHEREHTAQVREILAARRRWLLARLASERAGLLEQLTGLNEQTLTGATVVEGWTILDLLAHIAAWDRWENEAMHRMAAGEEPDFSALDDFDTSNAAFVAAWRERTAGLSPARATSEALSGLQAARTEWVTWLESLPEEEFFRARTYSEYDWSFPGPIQVQWSHDADHAGQIAAWQKSEGVTGKTGPKQVLRAALDAARQELLAAVGLVLPEARDSQPVCGPWTLKDLLGHIADWERFGVQGLRRMADGQPPGVERIDDIDAWNEAHVRTRRNQSWQRVWNDLSAARRELLEVIHRMDEAQLGQTFSFPWGSEGTPYEWVCIYLGHDREHAQGLRGDEEEQV